MPFISPHVPPLLLDLITLPNQKSFLGLDTEIIHSKKFKSGGIQLESGEDNRQYIHKSIPDGLYSAAKFYPCDFPSGQVFQWLPKESMHHLCDSLFTFINLSHK